MTDSLSENEYAFGFAEGYEMARLEANAADLVAEDVANVEVWIDHTGTLDFDFKGSTPQELTRLLDGLKAAEDQIIRALEHMEDENGGE